MRKFSILFLVVCVAITMAFTTGCKKGFSGYKYGKVDLNPQLTDRGMVSGRIIRKSDNKEVLYYELVDHKGNESSVNFLMDGSTEPTKIEKYRTYINTSDPKRMIVRILVNDRFFINVTSQEDIENNPFANVGMLKDFVLAFDLAGLEKIGADTKPKSEKLQKYLPKL